MTDHPAKPCDNLNTTCEAYPCCPCGRAARDLAPAATPDAGEREAFEVWYALDRSRTDSHLSLKIRAWEVWQARAARSAAPATPDAGEREGFQARVREWTVACFGIEIADDKTERNHRFIEEALELVQACGTTASEAHQLVDYVFGREVGEKNQETGGVMVTLAALCNAQGIDMAAAGEIENGRCWTKIEKIRAKQAAKPKHSPLPQAARSAARLRQSE